MYEATDILDLCQLKIMERGSSAPDLGCCNPLLFCLRNPLFAHEIGGRIKKLNQGLDDIKERSAAFNFLNLGSYEDRSMARPNNASYRKTDPVLERSGVVGEKIEEDTRSLVEKLRSKNGTDNVMVVAIVGVGGIGKTTLAKNVFNDEVIEQGFNTKIWLSVTKEFSESELLRTAIIKAKGILPEGGTQDKSLLVPALVSAIKDKKFFLVFDDMWGHKECNNFLKAPFSHGAAGSRVLITTRHDNVARGMKAIHPYHHVEKLEPEDSWTLLKKQVLTTEESEPVIDMLKDIGLQIIEKCGGLPLAVKVMGGLLCQREIEQSNWEKVLNDTIASQIPEELSQAIYLSYEDLSPSLKQCFLHFSLKPKKIILEDVQFIGMWIGEGFIHGNSDWLEEIGTQYHKELISRNLIEPDTEYPGQHICNMHDVVRSFAQSVTRDEALIVHEGEIVNSMLSSQRFLRLSIETNGARPDEFEWRSLQEQKLLRSVILVGKFKILSGDSLCSFSSLRVLHVDFANFAPLLASLYQLKHLRYLALLGCKDIKSLPENIHKMKFLQHIGLSGCENLLKLPNNIVMLRELRFLCLERTRVKSMPRGFHALKNLRTLHGFRAHMDGDWCSLEELGSLSNLRVIELVGLEDVSIPSFAKKARFCEKENLTRMVLECITSLGNDGLVKEGAPEEDRGITEKVFDELCPPPCIEDIIIRGYLGRRLPRWMMSTSSLNSLKILVMSGLTCCTKLPDGLCEFPCLEYLEVDHAPAIKSVGLEFVQPHGQYQHPSSKATSTFPRLHELNLNEMVEWEEWEWEEEVKAMPVLEILFIQCCKLRCIPPGLSTHTRALKELNIYNIRCLHSLENFASVVDLDLYKLPNLTSITNFPKLQKLEISCCQNLESLQEMNSLQRLVLTVNYNEKRLPEYLKTVKPSHLLLNSSLEILTSIAWGKSGSEWDKFSHIQRVEAYAKDGDDEKKWYVLYTCKPYNMETNIELNLQDISVDEEE